MNGGQAPGFTEESHAHDLDARIIVLSGGITVTPDNKADPRPPVDWDTS
jgi:hypothetical protein